MTQPDLYTHGHHDSVLRSHRWRNVDNSAAYLRPHLRAGQRLLDVGCGPGALTVDLARHVPGGRVVAVDRAEAVLGEARQVVAASGLPIDLAAADIYALPFPDGAFDVVHAHQVLQHLSDPVRALREMRRVCAPTGLAWISTDRNSGKNFVSRVRPRLWFTKAWGAAVVADVDRTSEARVRHASDRS